MSESHVTWLQSCKSWNLGPWYSDYATYRVECGVKHNGYDLGNPTFESLQDCVYSCINSADCVGLTMAVNEGDDTAEYIYGICQLKTEITPRTNPYPGQKYDFWISVKMTDEVVRTQQAN
jgi:hypothetical protein